MSLKLRGGRISFPENCASLMKRTFRDPGNIHPSGVMLGQRAGERQVRSGTLGT